jgi:hypothetical protein
MKRMFMSCVLAAFLPASALAHDGIDVQVSLAGGPGWGPEETWIEFEAERDAFVAVYATFSDGSVEIVFPVSAHESHWVDGRERYAVPVYSPRGAWLEDVQAVASSYWFDPFECWLAFDDGHDWRAPRVLVAAAWPTWSWGFSFAWSSPSRCWTQVRRIDWYVPRCDYGSRFDRAWYRSWDHDGHGNWDRGRDRGWDRTGNRSRERDVRTAASPSGSRGRHVVKGESRTPVRRVEAAKPSSRKVQAVKPAPHRKVAVVEERSARSGNAKANGSKREAVKERSPKRESGAKSNSVRWTAGGGSKAKAATAPGKKSSSSRGNSGEPKRRSGR